MLKYLRIEMLAFVSLLLCASQSSTIAGSGKASSIPPKRVVALDPSIAEIIIEIGCGEAIAAVPAEMSYPPGASTSSSKQRQENKMEPIDSNNFLWLEYGTQIKEKNGSVTQILRIKTGNSPLSGVSIPQFENLRAVYLVNGKSGYYSAPIHHDENGWRIDITAVRASFFEVFVFGGASDKRYFAETSFHLFASSDGTADRISANDVPENLPEVRIVSPKNNYWPQTGKKYKFAVNPGFCDFRDFKVEFFDGAKSGVLKLNDKLEFKYTPSHDRLLDMRGVTAFKGDVIKLTCESGDDDVCEITYTLLLHRSRFAHHKLQAGVALLIATIVILTGAVVIKRRLQPIGGIV